MRYKYAKIELGSADEFHCVEIKPETLGVLLDEYSDEVHCKREPRIPYEAWKMLSSIANDPQAIIQISNNEIYCEYSNNHEKYHFYIRPKDCLFVPFAIKQIYTDITSSSSIKVGVANIEIELDKVGICVRDYHGVFRDMADIIEELAEKWNSLNGSQQAAIIASCSTDFKDTLINKLTDKTERKDETMKGFNFDFGACKNENIRMSVYGLAIKNINDEWVSYDTKTGKIFNVDIFNFEGRNFFYKLPVAIKDIKIGDVIIHQRVPMFITSNIVDNKVVCVDPRSGEEKIIIPTASPFGFDFVTKVVSIFDMTNFGATSDTPFGNMLPFMMMGEDSDIDPMMLILMSQGAGAANNLFANPMMLYFLCNDKGSKDNMLPIMLMMNQNNK